MKEPTDPTPDARPEHAGAPDLSPELAQLIELAARIPEIGPPLAALAFKIGETLFAQRLLRLGFDRDTPSLEYYFVAANAARRDAKYDDLFACCVKAARVFHAMRDTELAPDDATRLMHLLRIGFSALMFDIKDVSANPEFVGALREILPGMDQRCGADPLYRSLLAQTLWYDDRTRSEEQWDLAVATDAPEHAWNARGTWYKEAEHDLDKAEAAYRKGREALATSPLLLHNLAQILVDKAQRPDVEMGVARRLLHEADDLLREALRAESPRGLRRHIHATRDRLADLRASLPPRTPRTNAPHKATAASPPEKPDFTAGQVLTGQVRSVAPFGVFVALPGGWVGLLHRSEIDAAAGTDLAHVLPVGTEVKVKVLRMEREQDGGRTRIALSHRTQAVQQEAPSTEIANPDGSLGERSRRLSDQSRGTQPDTTGSRPARSRRRQRHRQTDKVPSAAADGHSGYSLGDSLLAKLRAQEAKRS